MELLPPVGWADVATKRDLDALEERMNLRFDLVDRRFEASENKLLAAFRGELLCPVECHQRPDEDADHRQCGHRSVDGCPRLRRRQTDLSRLGAGVTAAAYLRGMKNLSGASLSRVLPTSHRPAQKLPLPAVGRTDGGPGEMTARSLARRLVLALHDLGLDGVVPAGWVSVDGAAVVFGELDVPGADHLVRHLEDLAADVADTLASQAAARRVAGPGQAPLFGGER